MTNPNHFRASLMIMAVAALTVALLVVSAPSASAAPSSAPDAGTAQVDGLVSTILAAGDRVYLGGDFTHVNGVSRNHLAAIDATTGELTSWNPDANGSVRALAVSPDGARIYAGGSFTSVGGTYRGSLAAMDATTGALDSTWRPGTANYSVRALAVSGNRVYIGGNFTTLGGQSRTRLALLDGTTGALDPNWTPTADSYVRTLALSGDGSRLYAGGDFTAISGQSRPYLAALNASTGARDDGWRPPSPNGRVFDLEVTGTRVYTAEGGYGGAAAAYDAGTGARAWSRSADGDAQAVAVLGDKVYIGGHFDAFDGQSRHAFAAVDAGTGALDTQWTPSGSPSFPGVWALTPDTARTRIYAGGDFTSISGRSYQRFAQFSEAPGTTPSDTTSPETTIDSGPSGTVKSNSAEFTFSSSEAGSTFECSLDGASFTACASPKNYTGLSSGKHTFQVRATDASNNTDSTPASRSWRVK